MRCAICGGEMGTAGCTQMWKHPRHDVMLVGSDVPLRDPRDAEIAALRAEVERLTEERARWESREEDLAKRRLMVESALDEARASLARVTEERDAARCAEAETNSELIIARSDLVCVRHERDEALARLCDALSYQNRYSEAVAECARLREEGAAREARGFAVGVEAACAFTMQDADDRNRSAPPSAHRVAGRLAAAFCARLRDACRRPSPAPSPMEPVPHNGPQPPQSGSDNRRAPSPKEDAPRWRDCTVCGGTGELQAGLVKTAPCHYCGGSGRSPDTTTKEK